MVSRAPRSGVVVGISCTGAPLGVERRLDPRDIAALLPVNGQVLPGELASLSVDLWTCAA